MTISLKTQKMLWGRAASRCSICKLELVLDATDTDDESLVGEACHIVAEKDDGPRGDPAFPVEARDKYANLLLLCRMHHKQIDDQVNTYSVDKLQEIKDAHVTWVSSQLNTYDGDKQRDDELYASYIDEWEKLIDLDNWQAWTSWLIGSGSLNTDMENKLSSLGNKFLSKIWSHRYPELELAFHNFRIVLRDLLFNFHEHSEDNGNGTLITPRFYKTDKYQYENYSRLLEQYKFHFDLLQDYVAELTRAANLVCSMIRKHVLRNYRLAHGAVLIDVGPDEDLKHWTYRPEYKLFDGKKMPYEGKQQFVATDRFSRDICFGRSN